jgi:hypothetical protein
LQQQQQRPFTLCLPRHFRNLEHQQKPGISADNSDTVADPEQ